MWRSINISKKIYISLGILLTGYFLSMLVGFLNGMDTEKRLQSVHAYLSPASLRTQVALTAFNNQVKIYEDIYMTGDDTLIEKADTEAAAVKKALKGISRLARQQPGNKSQQIDKLIIRFSQFSDEARKTYPALVLNIGSTMSSGENKFEKIRKLAGETTDIRKQLKALQNDYNKSLETQLFDVIAFSKRQRYINLLTFCLIAVFASALVSVILRRSITLPLKNAVDMVKGIAKGKGDLTRRLSIRNKDEVGELSKWFNAFMENMQDMTRSIISNVGTLRDSSTGLSEMSGMMSQTSEKMVEKNNSVSAAMEEMDATMRTIAVSMEEATSSTDQVANSAEQMSATINEIAKSSQRAADVTRQAVEKSHQASNRVGQLGSAADEIGKVTETINEISEQTNLLALNATIEAARAGEAGKGFAVVADEIKILARQTAEATLDIKERISGIQETTSGTVGDIREIANIIDKVNETVTIIAASVEEQSITTREIAGNVSEISKAIGDVNESVSQSSNFTTQVSEDIANVNRKSIDFSENSSRLKQNAEDLSRLADQLYQLVGQFKV